MNDDLKTRYDAINAKAEKLAERVQAGVTSPAAAFGVSVLLTEALGLARDAMERLENNARTTVTRCSPGFDACVDAVKWEQRPLNCQSIEIGGRGKIDVVECDIEGPCTGIDIREYFARS